MRDDSFASDSMEDIGSSIKKRETAPPRPLGISILSILHIVGGILLCGSQFLLFARLREAGDALPAVGIPPALLVVGVLFLSVLTLASGVGMRLGEKWGWWLRALYYVYSVFRNGSALLTVIMMADQFGAGSRGPSYYMIKYDARTVIHFALLFYFFKGNVLRYFRLESLNKPKAIGLLVGICIAISVVASLVVRFGE